MGEAARVFGKGGSVHFEGRDYTIAPYDLDMIAMTECWLEDRAWERVQRLRGKLDEEDYRERLRITAELVGSDTFSHSGPAFGRAVRSIKAQKFIWFLMLSRNPGMSESLAYRIFDAEAEMVIARKKTTNNPKEPVAGPTKGEGNASPEAQDHESEADFPFAPSSPSSSPTVASR